MKGHDALHHVTSPNCHLSDGCYYSNPNSNTNPNPNPNQWRFRVTTN